jgi:hypothetical protein
MKRSLFAALIAFAACATTATAAPPPSIKLTLTPAKPPTPALRYQLLPDGRNSISGNAATFGHQVNDRILSKGFDKAELFSVWSELPVEKLPKEEARQELAEYKEVFELLEMMARCDRCDWDQRARLRENGINTLLPELQPMRHTARLLALRARLAIADSKFELALATIRTGLALAKFMGESDTLIGFLVGTAMAAMMEKQLDELIGRPDAPNLYHALSNLPTPLISMRRGLEGERIGSYATFPGLTECATNLDAGNMTEQELGQCMKVLNMISGNNANRLERFALGALILNRQEAAKKALIGAGRPRDKVEAMPPLQVALLHAMNEYDTLLDEAIACQNLPYSEMTDRLKKLSTLPRGPKRLTDPNAPAIPLAAELFPALDRLAQRQFQHERKLAMLRTIEALRFYAATHDGKLPQALADVKEVSLPLDPVTGKAFPYTFDGDVATLSALPPGKEAANQSNSITYKLRSRN